MTRPPSEKTLQFLAAIAAAGVYGGRPAHIMKACGASDPDPTAWAASRFRKLDAGLVRWVVGTGKCRLIIQPLGLAVLVKHGKQRT